VDQSHELFAGVLHLKNAEIHVLIAEQQKKYEKPVRDDIMEKRLYRGVV